MLALATGWTPDVLADLPARFRAACHWALFARSLTGPNGLPSTEIPKGLSVEARHAAMFASARIARLREFLFPGD